MSGWVLTEAYCMNDIGQIAGIGTLNGVQRPFLIQPSFRVVNFIPAIFWHIVFGIVADQPGIILGPRGPEPGPDPEPIESLLRHLPEQLRPDLKNILANQQVRKAKNFRKR
jgi:hypothetical protein